MGHLRKFLQRILTRPVLRLAHKYSSKPNKQSVTDALNKLYDDIMEYPGKKGLFVPADSTTKIIIFSDVHKGNNKRADEFAIAAENYLAALNYYYDNGYTILLLGDIEELWKFNLFTIRASHTETFKTEKKFVREKRLIKVFGNHDIFWNNDPFAPLQLYSMYGEMIKVYEGVIFSYLENKHDNPLQIFCTHGHQGDKQSDGNKFSAWFVSKIWAPLQSYLGINLNTPAFNDILKTEHNLYMYEWAKKQHNTLLVTGHTHQPVFESMTHLERLFKQLLQARNQNDEKEIEHLQKEIKFRRQEYNHISEEYLNMHPGYFNTGCCCFNDGDMTGIELNSGNMELVKWKYTEDKSLREVLQTVSLNKLRSHLQ